MSDEAKQMRRQLSSYADAITAFATAQLVGFMLLMTHGDCSTKNVSNSTGYAAGIGVAANACYLGLVVLCHSKDDSLGKRRRRHQKSTIRDHPGGPLRNRLNSTCHKIRLATWTISHRSQGLVLNRSQCLAAPPDRI
jgi:hypothetical protein